MVLTHKRVFDLVMRNRTSKSLFRTRSSTAFIAPAALRPCRFATPSQARCWLRSTSANGWTPRSDAIFVSPLARKRTSGKQSRLAATGDYAPSLRSPWRAAFEGRDLRTFPPTARDDSDMAAARTLHCAETVEPVGDYRTTPCQAGFGIV